MDSNERRILRLHHTWTMFKSWEWSRSHLPSSSSHSRSSKYSHSLSTIQSLIHIQPPSLNKWVASYLDYKSSHFLSSWLCWTYTSHPFACYSLWRKTTGCNCLCHSHTLKSDHTHTLRFELLFWDYPIQIWIRKWELCRMGPAWHSRDGGFNRID